MAEYAVKGSSISSKLEFVDKEMGAAAREELEAAFADRLPVLPTAWYPFDFYVELLEDIARRYLRGELQRLRELGSFSANQSLQGTYRAFARGEDFVEFLRGSSRLHRMFYNQGTHEVAVDEDGTGCDVRLSDKPRYADADLWVSLGFYERAAELHGLEPTVAEWTHEDDGVTIRLRWLAADDAER